MSSITENEPLNPVLTEKMVIYISKLVLVPNQFQYHKIQMSRLSDYTFKEASSLRDACSTVIPFSQSFTSMV